VLIGFAVLTGLAATSSIGHADRGVGINLGRIAVDDRLAPGGSYSLPVLGVINTGDESGDYEVVITYHEGQQDIPVPQAWFLFRPQRFWLEAGEAQTVEISLALPTGADPGDYFGFIEAHPVAEGEGISIGLAAVTELSFSVKPSNWFQAQQVRLNRLISDSEPWSYVIPSVTLAVLLLSIVKRSIRIGIRVERR
jgi:hypothetical protein